MILCLHGHNHHDGATEVDGVHYLQINSASYLWVGEEYGRMAPYADALFGFLTLDPAGTIRLLGRASTFRRPTSRANRTIHLDAAATHPLARVCRPHRRKFVS